MSGASARAAAAATPSSPTPAGAAAACASSCGLAEPVLGDWMERHGEELHRHLCRMLKTEADAEDVLQEVWITAYRRPPDAGPGSNVRAWLYRVATNAALDRLARDRRRSTALSGRGHQLAPETTDPEERLGALGDRARERVRERVARLPRKQREAVWLRWVEGLDYDTIAARIDSTAESARANVYVGMKKLRAELFDLWQ